jgi:hypothetical protein
LIRIDATPLHDYGRAQMPAPLRAFVDVVKGEGVQRGDGDVRRTN